MRLLLLALSVLVFLPQVIPALTGEKKCLQKSGKCRNTCKDGEMAQKACKIGQVCCVPIVQKEGTVNGKVTEAAPTILYELSSYLSMMEPMPTMEYFEVKGNDKAVKVSSRWMKTRSSVPPGSYVTARMPLTF